MMIPLDWPFDPLTMPAQRCVQAILMPFIGILFPFTSGVGGLLLCECEYKKAYSAFLGCYAMGEVFVQMA